MIPSILDTDLYKFTQAQAVAEKFPRAVARYQLFNRDPDRKITRAMLDSIQVEINHAGTLRLTCDQGDWLYKTCRYFKPWFLSMIKDARLDPGQVFISDDGNIIVEGPWFSAILWEVPLLAIISEVCMTWDKSGATEMHILDEAGEKTKEKALALMNADCKFADFGTRRRFSLLVHDRVVSMLSHFGGCIGTSNMHLARKHGIKPIGTMAHEWVQGVSGLVGLRHANRYAMEAWHDVYRGKLGIALTDTFGSRAFWNDFDGAQARMYDGVRQDSGDPAVFAERAIAAYVERGIDPRTKTIVFSDGLDVVKAVSLQKRFGKRVKVIFGIGTNLTCDVDGHPPMNIVVKLTHIDGVPVVKLSDSPGKVVGDDEAVRVARWTFGVKG